MISTGKSPASAAASALLPLAVGPMRRIAAGSAAPHEEVVEIGEAPLVPGRAAGGAFARGLGFFPFPPQGVPFRKFQSPVGPHRAVTGPGSQEVVAALRQPA